MSIVAAVLTLIARFTLLFSKKPSQALEPTEKVWIHPSLIGYGKSRELEVGSLVKDRKGRLCVVAKQGRQGGLRLATERDMMRPMLEKAMREGPTPKMKAMMWMLAYKMWKARVKRSIFKGWTVDRAFFWFFIILPFSLGTITIFL